MYAGLGKINSGCCRLVLQFRGWLRTMAWKQIWYDQSPNLTNLMFCLQSNLQNEPSGSANHVFMSTTSPVNYVVTDTLVGELRSRGWRCIGRSCGVLHPGVTLLDSAGLFIIRSEIIWNVRIFNNGFPSLPCFLIDRESRLVISLIGGCWNAMYCCRVERMPTSANQNFCLHHEL